MTGMQRVPKLSTGPPTERNPAEVPDWLGLSRLSAGHHTVSLIPCHVPAVGHGGGTCPRSPAGRMIPSPPSTVIHAILPTMHHRQINLHLVSDSTGETLNSIARATLARFDDHHVTHHRWSLVRSRLQLD